MAGDGSDFISRMRALAEEMGLSGDEADAFVGQAAERKGGYKRVTTWVPDEGEGDNKKKGSTWFPEANK